MELGDLGSESLDIGHFINDIDEVTKKEVNLWIGSIGAPRDGSGSRVRDHLVQSCHGDIFSRHHGFSDVALGYLGLMAYDISSEDP